MSESRVGLNGRDRRRLSELAAARWARIRGARDRVRLMGALPLSTCAAILVVLLVWRMAILGASLLLGRVGQVRCGEHIAGVWRYSACWDTSAYHAIAARGYQDAAGVPSSAGYFPLYPLLMRAADRLVPGPGDLKAALIVGGLVMAAATLYVYLAVRLDFDDTIAWRAYAFLLVFPTAFFFSAAYPDALLLLTAAGTLYHARRGHWLRAGLFAAAGSATMFIGLLLVVPIAVELVAQRAVSRDRLRPLGAVALAPVGAVAFFAYLQWHFDDAWVFFDARREWHQEHFGAVFHLGIQRLLGDADLARDYYSPAITPTPSGWLLADTTLILITLLAGIVVWRKIRASYGLWIVANALALGFAGTPRGASRHVAVLFPAFLLLAKIESEPLRNALTVAFVMALGMETFLFINGWWAG